MAYNVASLHGRAPRVEALHSSRFGVADAIRVQRVEDGAEVSVTQPASRTNATASDCFIISARRIAS